MNFFQVVTYHNNLIDVILLFLAWNSFVLRLPQAQGHRHQKLLPGKNHNLVSHYHPFVLLCSLVRLVMIQSFDESTDVLLMMILFVT